MELTEEQIKSCEYHHENNITIGDWTAASKVGPINMDIYNHWFYQLRHSNKNPKPEAPVTAKDFLLACIDIQEERGKQYDSKGDGERSFAAVAAAFNAITGKDLKGSDICLIQQVLKDVRQYSDPARIHEDSLLDKVSYASLHVEELKKELSDNVKI